jgi:hypothetical protein
MQENSLADLHQQQTHFHLLQVPQVEYSDCMNRYLKIPSKLKLSKGNLMQSEPTKSWYTRSRSFTTSSVSSDLVISFDSHSGGGNSGGRYIRAPPFSPSISMEATLKFPPHWLHILLPRHLESRASSRSLRLITKSIFVAPSSIS